MKLLTHVQLFATPWTLAHQAPQSMRFSRQGYWSGSPFPSLGDLPNPGIAPGSPALQADSLPTELQGKHCKQDTTTTTTTTKSLQLCTTLCDPIDGSPPGSPVPGILQARQDTSP